MKDIKIEFMEALFRSNLTADGAGVEYEVIFDQEKYIFRPSGNEGESFSLRRVHDEWHGGENIPSPFREQAIEVLEKYLLQQH